MAGRKKSVRVDDELDITDISILSYLRDDSKTPIKKMAKELGVHPNTLIQRIRKMEKTGVIKKYNAAVNYSKTGLDLTIMIMMKVRRGRAGDLDQLKELIKIKEIESIHATTGTWDVIALCRVKNRKHLLDVIQRIGDHPIVVKTTSSIVLFTYKRPEDYNPFK